jgi:serine O-acetyltransferase
MFANLLDHLFTPTTLENIELDISRRLLKSGLENAPLLTRLRFYISGIQYRTLLYYRLWKGCNNPFLRGLFGRLYHGNSLRCGVSFNTPALGGGVIMPHWGRINVGATKIGHSAYIFHNVTIGNDYVTGRPTIGDNVFIGVNTVILGNITIGDNVIIGACSFVNKDIPSNCMAAGNPARVIKPIEPDAISKMIGY